MAIGSVPSQAWGHAHICLFLSKLVDTKGARFVETGMSNNSQDHLRLMKSSLLITLIRTWGPYVACLPGSNSMYVKAVASWSYRKMAGEPR